jgi:hypothetical protein
MRNLRALLRRPRWLSRPVAVLIAGVVGLGGLGGATGALLGELGAVRSAVHQDGERSDEGHHHDARFGHLGNDLDRDGNGRVPGPTSFG